MPGGSGSPSSAAAQAQGSSSTSSPRSATASNTPTASASDTIQRGKVRVGVNASLAPTKLPRKGTAPVHFSLEAKISATKGSVPPQLQKIEIEINRYGRIEPQGVGGLRSRTAPARHHRSRA